MAKNILPEKFIGDMTGYLGDGEAQKLFAALSSDPVSGLRINTLKVNVDEYLMISPFKLDPVAWCSDGFYYEGSESPGRHPHYHAGLYYIQEPSAMFPVEVLAPEPGERILDLCAAPGGKSVQIAAKMGNEGFLLSNDNDPKRVKALVKNIELSGVKNAYVGCLDPSALVSAFPGYFDGILVDAPCSGEGMFRRDEHAAKSWRKHGPGFYPRIQLGLLSAASRMLKPGGRMVYSTCTFSPEENEKVIADFLAADPDYELLPVRLDLPGRGGIENGRPEWIGHTDGTGYARYAGCADIIRNTARLWPHKLKAEGHFCALLGKKSNEVHYKGQDAQKDTTSVSNGKYTRMLEHAPDWFEAFASENLVGDAYLRIFGKDRGDFLISGDNLCFLPGNAPVPASISAGFIKLGLFLGTCLSGRFKPSHSLALSLKRPDFRRVLSLDAQSDYAARYLKGETLLLSGDKGMTIVCIDGFTVGWAFCDGNSCKNLYPSGWRKMR